MKKKLLVVLLIFVLVFSVVACSKPAKKEEPKDTGDKKTEKKEPEKKEKVVLNLLETSNIPKLVTWLSTDEVSFRILGNINSGLMNLDLERKAVPDGAEKVEVSPDGLKYTFTLRDTNWVTVDGKVYAPVVAEDYVYTWKKLVDPKEASQYSFMIKTASIKNGAKAVNLAEKIVAFNKAQEKVKTMKVGDFKAIEAQTPEQQLEKAKKDLDEKIAKEKDDKAKKALEDKKAKLKAESYKPIKAQTPQQQFDIAKKAADEALVKTKAAIDKEHGSVEKANEQVKKLIDQLGIKAIDKKTLVVELENPVPYFLELMTFPSYFPANKKFVEEKGDKYATSPDTFLYNGAYLFKEWKLSERHYLVKNQNYWDAKNVKVDEIDYRVVEKINNDTAVQMYMDKKIDRVGLSGENVSKFGNRPDATAEGDVVTFYLHVNQGHGSANVNTKILKNVKARKAMNMAIEKKFITDKIFANGSMPADYFVPKNFVNNKEGKDFRDVAGELFKGKDGYNKYNVEEAKKLWAEAKKEAGMSSVTLELIIYQGDNAAKVGAHIKNELEKNLEGLQINITALPFSEKIKRANQGDYDLDWAGWGPDYPDAMTFTDMWVTGGGHNTIGFSNPEYDKLIKEAKAGSLTAIDKTKERFEALVKTEKILLEDNQALIPLYQRGLIGLSNPKVKNYLVQKFGPTVLFKYVDIEK